MAKLTVHTPPPPPPPPPASYILTLSQDELDWLAALVGACGGGRPRELNLGLYEALADHKTKGRSLQCFTVCGWNGPQDDVT